MRARSRPSLTFGTHSTTGEAGPAAAAPGMRCILLGAMQFLPIGKLRAETLQAIFDKHPLRDPRVVVGPRVGEDAAVIDAGDRYLVATTDPITFATDEIGCARAQRAPRGRDRVRARRGARDARPEGRRDGDGARRAGGWGRGRAQDRPGPDHGIARGPDALRGVRPRPARHDRLGRPPHDVGARRRRPRHPRARPRVDRLPLHRPGGGAPAGRLARGRRPPGADAGVPTRRNRETLRGSLLTMPQIGYAHRPVALGRQGMVAAAHPLATLAGIETLKSGGTAADAAVAVNGVPAGTQANLCGLGGDLFCLYYEAATRRVHFLNRAGRSGARASLDELARRALDRLPVIGPSPVSVPGSVPPWARLPERFGPRPL